MTEEWDAQKPFIQALETDGYTKVVEKHDTYWAKPVGNGDDLTHQVRLDDVSDRGPCYIVRTHRLIRPDDGKVQWINTDYPFFNDGTGVRLSDDPGSPFQFFEYQDLV